MTIDLSDGGDIPPKPPERPALSGANALLISRAGRDAVANLLSFEFNHPDQRDAVMGKLRKAKRILSSLEVLADLLQ